ncbi:hypothetical protein P280DRAFT_520159 [Massarina eburnea CBS 473.64]|uniref:Uncharacterized protein n=1 Tax=Massarina eburnea CBS 473.64 TaxID=1395130 RepID=A0A6A6RXN9_9PLEO|nr:hypothetical protein P280DRAFT_520159 [Massarina eburnea CBS 473.64]
MSTSSTSQRRGSINSDSIRPFNPSEYFASFESDSRATEISAAPSYHTFAEPEPEPEPHEEHCPKDCSCRKDLQTLRNSLAPILNGIQNDLVPRVELIEEEIEDLRKRVGVGEYDDVSYTYHMDMLVARVTTLEKICRSTGVNNEEQIDLFTVADDDSRDRGEM